METTPDPFPVFVFRDKLKKVRGGLDGWVFADNEPADITYQGEPPILSEHALLGVKLTFTASTTNDTIMDDHVAGHGARTKRMDVVVGLKVEVELAAFGPQNAFVTTVQLANKEVALQAADGEDTGR